MRSLLHFIWTRWAPDSCTTIGKCILALVKFNFAFRCKRKGRRGSLGIRSITSGRRRHAGMPMGRWADGRRRRCRCTGMRTGRAARQSIYYIIDIYALTSEVIAPNKRMCVCACKFSVRWSISRGVARIFAGNYIWAGVRTHNIAKIRRGVDLGNGLEVPEQHASACAYVHTYVQHMCGRVGTGDEAPLTEFRVAMRRVDEIKLLYLC